MAIQKTIDGRGGVTVTDAYIKRQQIVIEGDGRAYVSVRIYKDEATHDANVENINDEILHPIEGADLVTLLAANASKGIEALADDFLKNTVYSGAVDV